LSYTDGEVGCTSSQGIPTSRGWFVGRQERETGVHNHKNILVKKTSETVLSEQKSKNLQTPV
jgi:hypothetical protein